MHFLDRPLQVLTPLLGIRVCAHTLTRLKYLCISHCSKPSAYINSFNVQNSPEVGRLPMPILQPHRESLSLARVCQSESSRWAPEFKLTNPAWDHVPNSAGVTPGCLRPPLQPSMSRCFSQTLPLAATLGHSLVSPLSLDQDMLETPPMGTEHGVHRPCGCLKPTDSAKELFGHVAKSTYGETTEKKQSESPEDRAAGATRSFSVGSGAGRTLLLNSCLINLHSHRRQAPPRISIQ